VSGSRCCFLRAAMDGGGEEASSAWSAGCHSCSARQVRDGHSLPGATRGVRKPHSRERCGHAASGHGSEIGASDAGSGGVRRGLETRDPLRLGVVRALERAGGASAGRMPKRRGHAVSRGREARGERPARGHGRPRARATRGSVPIAHAVGASGTEPTVVLRGLETRDPLSGGLETRDPLRLGVVRALERAGGASAGRMPKRRGHAVSRGRDARGERPARGHGRPRARATRGAVPIAHAIGASCTEPTVVLRGLETRAPLSGGLETRDPLRHGVVRALERAGGASAGRMPKRCVGHG